MRRMGAAGSDWSDWDAHLPGSPTNSGLVDSLGSSLNRTLSTPTTNKFEVAEGVHILGVVPTIRMQTIRRQVMLTKFVNTIEGPNNT